MTFSSGIVTPCRLVARVEPTLPVSRALQNAPVDAAFELLSRVFNLCAAAQRIALQSALGLEVGKKDIAALKAEIIREHMVRLCVMLPVMLGLPQRPLALRGHGSATLMGDVVFPKCGPDFVTALKRPDGVWPVMRAVYDGFARGEAGGQTLPPVSPATLFGTAPAVENSAALSYAKNPVMAYIERHRGRGPAWRLMGRILDVLTWQQGGGFRPFCPQRGIGVVRTARGLMAIEAKQSNGRLTLFRRVTPTDHMLAPGGILAQSLANLPLAKEDRAELVLAIIDPCLPVTLERQQDA